MVIRDMAYFMSEYFYGLHYKEHMAPNLTEQQKLDVAKRISNLTLEKAIWLNQDTDYKQQFPEIAQYVTDGVPLSGLYLVAIMKEIVKEFNPKLVI